MKEEEIEEFFGVDHVAQNEESIEYYNCTKEYIREKINEFLNDRFKSKNLIKVTLAFDFRDDLFQDHCFNLENSEND